MSSSANLANLGMCNIAQSVNVLSPLMTTKGVWKQTTWFPLLLFRKYMHGQTVFCSVRCGVYEGRTRPEWIRNNIDTPWLDVSAALSNDGWMSLAVVNISESKELKTEIEGLKTGGVKVYTVAGDSLLTKNDDGFERVKVVESNWDRIGAYTFSKHSLTMLRWQV